jgi:hypothetical protein
VSPKNARTARFRHALETSAVEIATRCLYLNEHSRISPENVIVISERPFLTMLDPLAQRRRAERFPGLRALEQQLHITC